MLNGYILFQELRVLNINGIEIDCETDWKPWPACEINKIKECRKSQTMNNEKENIT